MDSIHLPQWHSDQKNILFVRQALSGTEEFRTVAELFSLLGDPTRIRVFWLLCHCEQCVINIASLLEMSSPAVSHHLRALRETGLIIGRREGKEVFYRAADTETAQLLHRMIEETMSIACPQEAQMLSDFRADQVELVHAVHEHLLQHMEERVTIEELARNFHINPTTLKSVFKSVYGNSLAAHIKEHRMERAAELLRGTDLSIMEIARQVGYDSQSKLTAAFKSAYHVLPKEYRKAVSP